MTYGLISYLGHLQSGGSVFFDQVAIGGGGYVTGLDIAPDGTKLARVDVAGVYSSTNTTKWKPLFTTASLPASMAGLSSGTYPSTGSQILNNQNLGGYEARIAPSNSSVFYALVAGQMLVSTNAGTTWTVMSNFPSISYSNDANSGPRLLQRKMAVDPTNADVVYIGTPADGLFKTTNGTSGASATFTSVSGVPNTGTARNGIRGIVFDPATSGGTQRIYAATDAGVYATTNSGTSWTLTTGSSHNVSDSDIVNGILNCACLCPVVQTTSSWTTSSTTLSLALYTTITPGMTVVDISYFPTKTIGIVASVSGTTVTLNSAAAFASQGSSDFLQFVGNSIQTYTGGLAGTWSGIRTDAGGSVSLSINPFDSTWLATMGNGGGNLDQTGSLGTTNTWSGPYFTAGLNPNVPPSDVAWIADTLPGYPIFPSTNNPSASSLRFDPVVQNRVWMAWGYGVSFFDLPNASLASNTQMAWTSHSAGMEMLVTRCWVTQTGHAPLLAVEDQQVFQITNPIVYPPSGYGPGVRSTNSAAWSMDGSLSTAGVVSILTTGYYAGNGSGHYSGYSTDGGSTWTVFSTTPTAVDGGCITGTDSNHHIIIPGGTSVQPIFTANGGSTWTSCTGLPSGIPYIGANGLKYNPPQILTNDAAGNGYCYVGGGGTNGGTYRTNATNDLSAWTKVSSTDLTLPEFFGCIIKACPNVNGKLFFCLGQTNVLGQSFYTCLDNPTGSITWSAVSNVQDVYCFGFGAVASGFSNPTLWLIGWVNKGGAGYKYGVWKSRDLGVSDWTWYTDFPAGNPDLPICISGDMNNSTKCYIGFTGTTAMYGINLT